MQWILLILSYIHIAQTTEYNNLSNNKSNKRTYYDVNNYENIPKKKKKVKTLATTLEIKENEYQTKMKDQTLNSLQNFCSRRNKDVDDSKNNKLNNPFFIPSSTCENSKNITKHLYPKDYHNNNDPDAKHNSNKDTSYKSVLFNNYYNNNKIVDNQEVNLSENSDSNLNIYYEEIKDNDTTSMQVNYTEIEKIEQIINNFRIKTRKKSKNNDYVSNKNFIHNRNNIKDNEFVQLLIKIINFILKNKTTLFYWINNITNNFFKIKFSDFLNVNKKYNNLALFKIVCDNMLVFHSLLKKDQNAIDLKKIFKTIFTRQIKNIDCKIEIFNSQFEKCNMLYVYSTNYENFIKNYTLVQLIESINCFDELKDNYLALFLKKLCYLGFYKRIFNVYYLLADHKLFIKLFLMINNASAHFDIHYQQLQKHFLLFDFSDKYKVSFSDLNDKNHFMYFYIIDWIIYIFYNSHIAQYDIDNYAYIEINLDHNSSFINFLTLMYVIIRNDVNILLKYNEERFMRKWKCEIISNLPRFFNLVDQNNLNMNFSNVFEEIDNKNGLIKNRIYLMLSNSNNINNYTNEILFIINEMHACINNAFINSLG